MLGIAAPHHPKTDLFNMSPVVRLPHGLGPGWFEDCFKKTDIIDDSEMWDNKHEIMAETERRTDSTSDKKLQTGENIRRKIGMSTTEKAKYLQCEELQRIRSQSCDKGETQQPKRVRFSDTLVSDVHYRPRTTAEEWANLFYTCHEIQIFWDESVAEKLGEEDRRSGVTSGSTRGGNGGEQGKAIAEDYDFNWDDDGFSWDDE
mmetsp:Transcript_20978/g.42306  ORF Transcript_20978/g.42306 Transcript_20978/m.42306 type:complete len:203 (-) Transcript_20978:17-625(-)